MKEIVKKVESAVKVDCTKCNGTGKINKEKCSTCKGTGKADLLTD